LRLAAWSCLAASPVSGQEAGSVLGRVVAAETGQPLPNARIELVDQPGATLSADDGRFILVGVPPGDRTLRISLIGYRSLTVDGVFVRAGRGTRVDPQLVPEALELPGVTAEVDRIRLIEPEISATHEVVLGRELRELPADNVAEVVELAPGVSDGHFRGGRVGQEVYVIDGLEFKNQLEASSSGTGLELPPTSLQELEVMTGGMGAQYGNALSGVVRYVTRRGDAERWGAVSSFRTDHWAPDELYRGFSSLSVTAGGPLAFLGPGSTLFADLLVQGLQDADPRARGLTCLRQGDGDAALDGLIRDVVEDATTARLYCPYQDPSFPHQQGEKILGFLRWDQAIGSGLGLTASLLANRFQRQLYTSELKYNAEDQLGQRTKGLLAMVALDWTKQAVGSGVHVTARLSAVRLDRHLGALDPWTFNGRGRIGGVGLADFRFRGEEFVRSPIEEQLLSGSAVPGYRDPGGSTGSPFGPAGEGIFFTEGTTDLANWSRSEFLAADVVGEVLSAAGHRLRGGASGKWWRVERYERVLSHLAGSSPNYTRFFPTTLGGFAEVTLAAADELNVYVGARVEAFQSGLSFRPDRVDFLSPVVDTEWKTAVLPRIGVTGPIPGTEGRTAFRFNYGVVSQPPDFQFFLDTSIGDSLRTDVRRQGNPNLSFERGTAFEVALSHLFTDAVAATLVGFRKELTNLVSGSLDFPGFAPNQFTTGDFGTVRGLELSLRGQWRRVRARLGYSLQKATGVVSSALADEPEVAGASREEFPLSFDRRHSGNLALLFGRAAGDPEPPWSLSTVATLKSGYPIVRARDEVESDVTGEPTHLPWTFRVDVRGAWRFGSLPGCAACGWRVLAEVKNLFGQDNVVALRGDTRTVAPPAEAVEELARGLAISHPIPRESPRYSAQIDLDGDGRITPMEFDKARLAAALDRFDPSLFYGEPLQLRLGVEVVF
jgi:hypothetical protein